ncbi:MAG: methyl-accepting chemotaxis protein [Sterolibacteriaceae bacterium MAG5]|nr:methyl-accepting chemotaxis protein [Candidatus Nitricoxidireducens bremensis]
MLGRLNHLNFRFIVLASLGAPALLLWIAGYYAWDSWRGYNNLRTTIQANALADNIIAAAGLQALERGVTASLLSASGPAAEAARGRVAGLREKSDALWRDSLAVAEKLETDGTVFPGEIVARKQAVEAYQKLAEARRRVDASLAKAERDIVAAEWIPVITRFINAAARMRIAAFGGDAFPPEITYPNLTAKHSVWLASEYAGLERATVATLINSNGPAAADVMQRLRAFRQIVETNIADVRFVRDVPGIDPQILAAIDGMEKQFLGDFESVRKQVYAEAESRTPAVEGRHYSMTSGEWIEKSTTAINAILKVSETYSKVGNDEAERNAQIKFIQMLGYIGLFLAMIAASLVTISLLFNKLRHLDNLRDSMAAFASGQGDLTCRLTADTRDEIGQTSAAFNRFAEKLQEIITETRLVVQQLTDAAAKLSAASGKVTASSSTQSEMSLTTAAAVEEITASIGQVAERARETLADSQHAGELAEEGARMVHTVADRIKELAGAVAESSQRVEGLGERSREIGGIVHVIREIADQTNLLALNAAIEAARAGEQGRGFAVVADEVRKLAERTGVATVDISNMIETIQRDTDGAVEGMHASGKRLEDVVALTSEAAGTLSEISSGAEQTRSRVDDIARATQEESVAGMEIARNVERVAQMAEENKLAAGETADDVQLLRSLADKLHNLVGRFKV